MQVDRGATRQGGKNAAIRVIWSFVSETTARVWCDKQIQAVMTAQQVLESILLPPSTLH